MYCIFADNDKSSEPHYSFWRRDLKVGLTMLCLELYNSSTITEYSLHQSIAKYISELKINEKENFMNSLDQTELSQGPFGFVQQL